jgi:hypothetical protein
MKVDNLKNMCLSLIKADSENEVIEILQSAGYWHNNSYWRNYGDIENNYAPIGNQSSSSDAALVEKIINSVDARLMNECMVRGIDPESSEAPKSIHEGVAVLIQDAKPGHGNFSGRITEWTDAERNRVAKDITVSVTGYRPQEGKPCIIVSDCGEGQTPDMMPETFLSINKNNKTRIRFVQGKFNMGGTGVLRFCGKNNLQLILSKRNPLLVNRSESSDDLYVIRTFRTLSVEL